MRITTTSSPQQACFSPAESSTIHIELPLVRRTASGKFENYTETEDVQVSSVEKNHLVAMVRAESSVPKETPDAAERMKEKKAIASEPLQHLIWPSRYNDSAPGNRTIERVLNAPGPQFESVTGGINPKTGVSFRVNYEAALHPENLKPAEYAMYMEACAAVRSVMSVGTPPYTYDSNRPAGSGRAGSVRIGGSDFWNENPQVGSAIVVAP